MLEGVEVIITRKEDSCVISKKTCNEMVMVRVSLEALEHRVAEHTG